MYSFSGYGFAGGIALHLDTRALLRIRIASIAVHDASMGYLLETIPHRTSGERVPFSYSC